MMLAGPRERQLVGIKTKACPICKEAQLGSTISLLPAPHALRTWVSGQGGDMPVLGQQCLLAATNPPAPGLVSSSRGRSGA